MTPRCEICGHLSAPHDPVRMAPYSDGPDIAICVDANACRDRLAMQSPAFLAHCKAQGVDIGSVPEEERPFHLRAFRRVQSIQKKETSNG